MITRKKQRFLQQTSAKIKIFSAVFILLLTTYSCSPTADKENTELGDAQIDSTWFKLSESEKRSAKNAVGGLDVVEDLEVSLFSSEPMMINPTNMDIDAKGRVWICEAYNYRNELNPENPVRKEGDRILILEDTNQDGKADKEKVFYQGNEINAALGIWVMGNKAIVSCSPNIFIFTDSDGDDVADQKEILFTGMDGKQHDHAVHAVVFGADGKLYFNYGNEGGQLKDKDGNIISDKATGNEIIGNGKPFRQGMIFRCNPDGSDVEVLAHNFRNNYEVAVDSYGTLWQSDNDDDGNRAVRINYVMEYGNYGYQDELTGAGWRSRRTNMETEIPLQHWHQNDPGVVPNLLQTGAGSPTGLLVYEGTLLPERFRGQMIHADAGPNIVRSYSVTNDGAGYKAEINDIIKGRDQWFRPSDVTIAPDGSLFIADWYDPGVGGHLMGDQERGRIYRVAPKGHQYKVPSFDFSTNEGAAEALKNPNLSVRYLAWTKLHEAGLEAKPQLELLWKDENPRFRARAFWLLAQLDGTGEEYLLKALKDENSDIRITGLRAARQLRKDIIPYAKLLINDNSTQVRREVALALRGSKSAEAPELWTKLAQQHDGKDRWYLEALGIGAEGQWDAFMEAYMQENNTKADSKSTRDIVWRSRTSLSLPLLAGYISSHSIDSTERLRYFRAFDYHQHPSKQIYLVDLLNIDHPEKEKIAETALLHLDSKSAQSPQVQAALNRTLENVKGTLKYIDLVDRFGIKTKNKELLKMIVDNPEQTVRVDAVKALLKSGGKNLLKAEITNDNDESTIAALKAMAYVQTDEIMDMIQAIMMNPKNKLEIRQQAVKSLGMGWGGEDRLLEVVKLGQLHKDLEHIAANVLNNAYRGSIKEGAIKYLKVGNSGSSENLSTITELVQRNGDPTNGKLIFTQTCNSCHLVNKNGTNFGPELSEIGNKLSKSGIYMAIIHPDAGISFGFEGYIIKLKDESVKVGFIISETEEEFELRMAGGITSRISKAEIISKNKIETSLMPKNLERTMSEQDLVDLVEYLSSLKKAQS